MYGTGCSVPQASGLGDGMAEVPRRDTAPSSRGLDLHSGALGAQVHDVRNFQHTMVDDGHCANGLVWASLDREGGGVPSVIGDGHGPPPGLAGRGLYRELG